MYDLSIIVPVYNAENYLENTIDALLTQEGLSYEIILVDDGSKDGSGPLCDRLCTIHKNVKCIHEKNGGPGKARNVGIESAEGIYLAFCDSDDIPANNMYGILYKTISENDCDYCLCDIYTERDGRNFGFPWNGDMLFVDNENTDVLLASMLGNRDDNEKTIPVWGSSVRALYKKAILDAFEIRFPEDIRFAEDLVFNARYLLHCRRSYVLNKVLYRYTWNKDSLMNSFVQYNASRFAERLALVKYLRDIIDSIDTNQELRKRLATSARCYYHECVGNAARAIPEKGVRYAYREIKEIVNNCSVQNVFKDFSIANTQKKLVYTAINKRRAGILTLYYAIRLRESRQRR